MIITPFVAAYMQITSFYCGPYELFLEESKREKAVKTVEMTVMEWRLEEWKTPKLRVVVVFDTRSGQVCKLRVEIRDEQQ